MTRLGKLQSQTVRALRAALSREFMALALASIAAGVVPFAINIGILVGRLLGPRGLAAACGVAAGYRFDALLTLAGFAVLQATTKKAATFQFLLVALLAGILTHLLSGVSDVSFADLATLTVNQEHVGIFAALGFNGRLLVESWHPTLFALALLLGVLTTITSSMRPSASAEVRALSAAAIGMALVCFLPLLRIDSGLFVLPVLFVAAKRVKAIRPVLYIFCALQMIDVYLMSHFRNELFPYVADAVHWRTPHRLMSFLWKVVLLTLLIARLKSVSTGIASPKTQRRLEPKKARPPDVVSPHVTAMPVPVLAYVKRRFADLPSPFSLARADLVALVGISIFSVSLGLFHLGRLDLPSTSLTAGRHHVRIEIPDGKSIQYLYYFAQSGTVELTATCPSTGERKGSTIPWRNLYQWNVLALVAPCQESLDLKVVTDSAGLLSEVRFADPAFKRVRPTAICQPDCSAPEATPLFDEVGDIAALPSFQDGAAMDELYNFGPGVKIISGVGSESTEFTSHPYLGRLLIMQSMRYFGISPFAWRLPSALLGALIPIIVFFLIRETVARRDVAWIGCFLALFEFGRLVLSRTAFVDAQVTFFVMVGYVFLFRYVRNFFARSPTPKHAALTPLVVSAIAIGAAGAAKWSGFFSAPLIAICCTLCIWGALKISWRRAQREFLRWTICFCTLPAAIYFMAYMPFLTDDTKAVSTLLEHQARIIKIHAHDATVLFHQFASRFPSWLFAEVALPIFRLNHGREVSSVYLMSHPLLSWLMMPAFVVCLWRRRLRNNVGLLFLLGIALTHFLPWSLVARQTQNYHFLPTSMASTAMIAVVIATFFRQNRKMMIAFCTTYLAVFCAYLPFVYQWPVSRAYLSFVKLFDSWFGSMGQ